MEKSIYVGALQLHIKHIILFTEAIGLAPLNFLFLIDQMEPVGTNADSTEALYQQQLNTMVSSPSLTT